MRWLRRMRPDGCWGSLPFDSTADSSRVNYPVRLFTRRSGLEQVLPREQCLVKAGCRQKIEATLAACRHPVYSHLDRLRNYPVLCLLRLLVSPGASCLLGIGMRNLGHHIFRVAVVDEKVQRGVNDLDAPRAWIEIEKRRDYVLAGLERS